MTAISLGRTLPRASLRLVLIGGHPPRFRGRASCFRWGLPERASPRNSVSSYLTISTLPQNASILGTPFGVKALRCFAPARPHTNPYGAPSSQTFKGGVFLWHFPSSCPDRTLSCTLPW